MNLSSKVMQAELPKLCLLVATLAVGSAAGSGPCERGRSWWNRTLGACVPCTRCDSTSQIPLVPCELHRDTECQSLYDVKFRNELSSDYEYYEYTDDGESDNNSEGEVKWVLQASTLSLAVSGCVVFFLVVLFLSLHHAKQWRVLKQALKSDVEDLSAKLKLVEAGLEAPAEPVAPTDHHIYCNIHVPKDALLGSPSKKGLGNVYTQEKHPS